MVRTMLLVTAAFVITGCGKQDRSAAAIAELGAADAALSDAVAKQDLERIASFYAEEAVSMPTAEPLIRGKAAIRDEWRHVLGIPGMQSASTTRQVDVSASGDFGYTRGEYTSRMVGQDGLPVTEPGKWLSVWKKQPDGNWRIVVDTFNTDIMPPLHAESTAH
jgi:ketosteroid isomerase-like protein